MSLDENSIGIIESALWLYRQKHGMSAEQHRSIVDGVRSTRFKEVGQVLFVRDADGDAQASARFSGWTPARGQKLYIKVD